MVLREWAGGMRLFSLAGVVRAVSPPNSRLCPSASRVAVNCGLLCTAVRFFFMGHISLVDVWFCTFVVVMYDCECLMYCMTMEQLCTVR